MASAKWPRQDLMCVFARLRRCAATRALKSKVVADGTDHKPGHAKNWFWLGGAALTGVVIQFWPGLSRGVMER